MIGYPPNNIRKAIINANKPTASVNANPKIAELNNCCFNDGFLAYAITNAANTRPTPVPTPSPMESYQEFTLYEVVKRWMNIIQTQ